MNSFSNVENAVILPRVDIGRSARLRNVVIDAEVKIPEGLVVGEDPEFDAKRFRRTESGICLITQPMIDRLLDHPTIHQVPELPPLFQTPGQGPLSVQQTPELPPIPKAPEQALPSVTDAEEEADHAVNGLDHDATKEVREGEAVTGGLEA